MLAGKLWPLTFVLFGLPRPVARPRPVWEDAHSLQSSMREIIHVQVGQAGNQVSSKAWESILREHALDNTGHFTEAATDVHKYGIDVYFQETEGAKYVPRSVLVDLGAPPRLITSLPLFPPFSPQFPTHISFPEPGVIGSIRAGPMGKLFKPQSCVQGRNGAGNNFAKAHYTEGAEYVAQAMEALRKEAEQCESLQGFQMAHSLGGGTGSGLGSLLLSTLRSVETPQPFPPLLLLLSSLFLAHTSLREEYPDRVLSTYSILPSPKVSDTVVEPYNTILALNQLIENVDHTVMVDNEALHNICVRSLKLNTFAVLDSFLSSFSSFLPFLFSSSSLAPTTTTSTSSLPPS